MAKTKQRWWDNDNLPNSSDMQTGADLQTGHTPRPPVVSAPQQNQTAVRQVPQSIPNPNEKMNQSDISVQQRNFRTEAEHKTPVSDVSNEKEKLKKEKGVFFDVITYVLIGVLIGVLISHFVFELSEVQGISMSPTLKDEDIILVDTLTRHFLSYKRGDIVVVDTSDIQNKNIGNYIIKRIIGLPGEKISFSQGDVYINSTLLEEDYLDGDIDTYYSPANTEFVEIQLGENEYFCMGDNRVLSMDSREIGVITKDNFTGKAFLKISPFKSFGLLCI